MTNTSSFLLTHLPKKDQFPISIPTPYANELDRQIRLDRLAQFFNSLTKKSNTIRHQINELRNLQEDIIRLDKKI